MTSFLLVQQQVLPKFSAKLMWTFLSKVLASLGKVKVKQKLYTNNNNNKEFEKKIKPFWNIIPETFQQNHKKKW